MEYLEQLSIFKTDLSVILLMEGAVISSSFFMDLGVGFQSLVLLLSRIIRGGLGVRRVRGAWVNPISNNNCLKKVLTI